jgi:hypothetical protein
MAYLVAIADVTKRCLHRPANRSSAHNWSVLATTSAHGVTGTLAAEAYRAGRLQVEQW